VVGEDHAIVVQTVLFEGQGSFERVDDLSRIGKLRHRDIQIS